MPHKSRLAFSTLATNLLAVITLLNTASAANFKIVRQFNATDGGGASDVVFDKAGNLYGTTALGGSGGCLCGTVFELTPTSGGQWKETILYSFTNKNGDAYRPDSGVIFDHAGNLYGETLFGGTYAHGAIYRLRPNGDGAWMEDVLYSFAGKSAGSDPNGGLVFDTNDNLYGVAYVQDRGLAFQLRPNSDGSWNYQNIYQFQGGSDGSDPVGIRVGAGNVLYGATYAGGGTGCTFNGCGTVFTLTPNSAGGWTEAILYRFTGGADGANPISNVTLDLAQNLYGTTGYGGYVCPEEGAGCGVVFQLPPQPDGSWQESVLHTFGHGKDGFQPWGPLTRDSKNNLYGTTFFGGSLGSGMVFELTSNSKGEWSETQLHAFTGAGDGSSPRQRLQLDPSGNLYSSSSGGATSYDLVFEIMK